MKLRTALLVIAAMSVACGVYGWGPDDRERSLTGMFYGTFEGSEKGNPFTRTANLAFDQNGSTVSGSFSIVGGYGLGSVTGTVTGSTLSFTFDQSVPCPGTFTGTASLAGDRLTGTYSGASCRGAVTGSFEVNRIPEAVPL